MAALPTTATLSSGNSSDLTRCLRVIMPLTNCSLVSTLPSEWPSLICADATCSSLALSASSRAFRRTSTFSLTAASSAAWALARPPSKRPGAVRATAPATASSRRDTFMGSSSSRSRLQHCMRPRLHLRELPGDEPFVEGGRHGRVPGARQHGRKLPGLELIDRPLEGVRHQRLVEIDPLVLVPGPVVVVRVDAEAVEGVQLGLLAGDVTEYVDGDSAVALAGHAHLQAEADVARLDHVGPSVVANRAALADRHLARLGLHLVQRGHQLRGIDLQRDLLVPGAAQHRGQPPAQLRHGPPERVAGDGGIEHDADIRVRRIVVIVGMIVEALESE